MLKRTIAISLLVLLTVGICLPFVVSNAHGVRQNSQVGQRRPHRSRAWWRRYRARLRKKRAAAMELARRKALLTLPADINLGNFIAVVPTTPNVAPAVTIAPSVPSVNVTAVDLSVNTATVAPAVVFAPVAPVVTSPKFNAAPFAPTLNAARAARVVSAPNVAPTLNVAPAAPQVDVALPAPQVNIARIAPTVKAAPAARSASTFNAAPFTPPANTPSLGPIVKTSSVLPVVKAAPVASLVNTAHVAPSVNITSLSAPVNAAFVVPNVAAPAVRVVAPTVPIRSTRTTMATSSVGTASTLVNAPIVAPPTASKAAVEPRPVTDTRLRPKNPVSPLPGQLSIAVVALSRPNPAFLTVREEQKLLAGVAFGDLRRIVINRMVMAGGWVTNDYVREINGGRVFVVTAKTPKDGQTPEKVWTFYFTESAGRIYSLTTDSPAEHTERMSREAERFIGTLRSTPVEK
jgi:hypothetical protein